MSKIYTEIEGIKSKIFTIRGTKVMLDRDLAELYQVETKSFNQSVRRNADRFPSDFMFQLTKNELESLRSQFVTSKKRRGGTRYLPYVFTELGVAMLSSVLKSKIAVQINIRIMRAFVEIRQTIAAQPEYEKLKDRVKRIELQIEAMTAHNHVDGAILERKITSMSADMRRISETLDKFQDAYLVIKRPDDKIGANDESN